MKARIPSRLLRLYKKFDDCERCKKEHNPFRHILGGGKFKNPQFLFLFINPTHLNISSHKNYPGQRRFPFIGVRHFYRLLAKAGFLNPAIVEDIYKNGWQVHHEVEIEQSLTENDIYLTNLVKCAQPHPGNPSMKIIMEDFPLLQQEINLVLPKLIVTFGVLPFRVITGKNIRLADYFIQLKENSCPSFKSVSILGKIYDVLPCYFPIGRGNTERAVEVLKYIKERHPL